MNQPPRAQSDGGTGKNIPIIPIPAHISNIFNIFIILRLVVFTIVTLLCYNDIIKTRWRNKHIKKQEEFS